jgi:uncharacterized membrane protein
MLYILLYAAIISNTGNCFVFLFTMPGNPSSKIFATVPKKQYVQSVFRVEFSKTENYRVPKKSVFSALICAWMIVLFDSFHFVWNVFNLVFGYIISATIVCLLAIENKQVCDKIIKQNLSHFSTVRYIDFFFPVVGWASLSLAKLVCSLPKLIDKKHRFSPVGENTFYSDAFYAMDAFFTSRTI